MALPVRPGMTVPLPGPLHSHQAKLAELADLGYTDIWSAESDGADAFTPLALAAAWEPRLRLGTAIVPAYTRSPACFAQSVASMADAAPGRFAIGIGSSSNVIVERWNGLKFEEPYKKVRDVVRFLNDASTARRSPRPTTPSRSADSGSACVPSRRPTILVAALREGMLRLAGREADGAIINWLSADDVRQVVPVVRDAAGGDDREIVARIFCCPSENTDVVRGAARYAIAAYLNVPVYAQFHEWLGRGAATAGDVGRLEGRRPQGGPGRDPRRGGRCARGARLGRTVSSDDPDLLRQRRDDDVAGDHAARPRAELLGGGPRAVAQRRLIHGGPLVVTGGQELADFRDVTKATFACVARELESGADRRRLEQRELFGPVGTPCDLG